MANKNKDKKTFLGMPMNWDRKNILRTMWNKDDDTIFPPKSFGIGWTINFHALLKASGMVSTDSSNKPRKKD
jgi:hypothetical protein